MNKEDAPFKVLGLDLSLRRTGWACGPMTGVIIPGKLDGMQRLKFVRSAVLRMTPGITMVAVEGYSFGSRDSHAHALGELGGVVRLALSELQLPYADIPPTCVKKFATGKGNAPKDAVFGEAIRRLGYKGADNNEADALWLHAMAMEHYGTPVIDVPAEHKKGLLKIQWPEL